ncbi:unnamed protein product [Trifolium pratense]|uniref:Uncharacterized protein n=1 Tax=Trifolium pratense TaxID=57577 RepID=A0ACB0IW33_TRIPR|nr:unnamed protein product [Trifolium pratense]
MGTHIVLVVGLICAVFDVKSMKSREILIKQSTQLKSLTLSSLPKLKQIWNFKVTLIPKPSYRKNKLTGSTDGGGGGGGWEKEYGLGFQRDRRRRFRDLGFQREKFYVFAVIWDLGIWDLGISKSFMP